jgi:membrane protein implicated in regulation of membrane protease activity
MAITKDDCDILIPYQQHMARICFATCTLVVGGGFCVLAAALLWKWDTIVTAGGSVLAVIGLVPFQLYYSHEQNLTLLKQVRGALARGVVLSDFTLAEVNKLFAGKA